MTPAQKKARQAEQEAEYQALRQQLKAFEPGLTDEDVDEWIRDALSAFGICNTDVQGCVLARTSAETKIRALKALLN